MQTLEQMVTDPEELYLGVLEGGKDLEILKRAKGLQDLSRHPHEDSLSETPTILCWKKTGRVLNDELHSSSRC
ncbi:hypothetical protein DV515_00005748 [Chloebia gouldiae]|uniref:Uncharacterized protein n=1 Tax=Chloebia gouldiae TaxID=44316 RepID=A0A3L8SLT7_CHLGU|nr:hypothetical protein DV515_00005748 [Chloebia gouldiae]